MSAAACGLPERSARPRQGRRRWSSSSSGLQLCRWRQGQQAVELWPRLDAELAALPTRGLGGRRHRGLQAEPHPAPYAATSGERGRDPGQLAHKCRASTGIGTAPPSRARATLQTRLPRPSTLGKHSNPRAALACAACRGARRRAESCPSRKLQKCACGTCNHMLSVARFLFGPSACVVVTESPQSYHAVWAYSKIFPVVPSPAPTTSRRRTPSRLRPRRVRVSPKPMVRLIYVCYR